MPEITAITPQVKDKDRCNIYVDGRFYCGLKLETALAHRLKAGQQVDLAELDAIQAENETSQALDKAMTHLSASMKTEKQVRDYLKKKGYVDAVCDQVLEKLRGYGFVDDAEYCAQYIRSAGKDKGARLIALELKKRGVWIYAADMDGEPWCQVDYTGAVGLVIGSEGFGVSRLVKEKSDFIISLPMRGKINSLNASVACGVVCYEVARQRAGLGRR